MSNLNCKGTFTIEVTDDGVELSLELFDADGTPIKEPNDEAEFAALPKELKLVTSAIYCAREEASAMIHRTIETNKIASAMQEAGHSMDEIMEAIAKLAPEGAALFNTQDNSLYDPETGESREVGAGGDEETKPSILH